MAVTSSSTLAQIKADYEDNADYDLEASTAKCKLFIHAARLLVSRVSEEAENAGRKVGTRTQKYETEIKAAKDWLALNDSTYAGNSQNQEAYTFPSFDNFRGVC